MARSARSSRHCARQPDADGDEVIEEFVDDGYSGARLDRPALDRLRDAAEAGALDGVICLCADRLARVYAYQVLIIEELAAVRGQRAVPRGAGARRGPSDDAAGADAGCDRRVRAREDRRALPARQALPSPAGRDPVLEDLLRRTGVSVPADGGPARIEIFEPEAEIVRWIFHAYVEKGRSIRQIALDLLDRGIPSPTGKPSVGHLYDHAAAEQRGIYRDRLLQPPRIARGQRSARRAQPQDPQPRTTPRRVDPDPGPGDHRPRHVRPRQADQAATTRSGTRAARNGACGYCAG